MTIRHRVARCEHVPSTVCGCGASPVAREARAAGPADVPVVTIAQSFRATGAASPVATYRPLTRGALFLVRAAHRGSEIPDRCRQFVDLSLKAGDLPSDSNPCLLVVLGHELRVWKTLAAPV